MDFAASLGDLPVKVADGQGLRKHMLLGETMGKPWENHGKPWENLTVLKQMSIDFLVSRCEIVTARDPPSTTGAKKMGKFFLGGLVTSICIL